MAGIKDIAKETGLGIATVSKYINGGNVRPENKILLEQAVKRLNYKVNNAARTLKTNKSKMIGIIVPELSNSFTTTIITAAEDRLMERGYGVIISDCRSNIERESKSIDFLRSKQVDGIINMPVCTDDTNLRKTNDIPIVVIDRKIEGYSHVGVNNKQAGMLATQLLVDGNHKKIAILAGPYDLSTARERSDGYKEVMEQNNINDLHIMHGDFTIESGYESMKKLIEEANDITAVFAANYELTVGAIIALNEAGLRIPEDISMVGFDNVELSNVINPKLSIIIQPIIEIANKAVDLMLSLLEENNKCEEIILEPFIEQGKSIKII